MGMKRKVVRKLSNTQKKVRKVPLGSGLAKKTSLTIQKRRKRQSAILKELGY